MKNETENVAVLPEQKKNVVNGVAPIVNLGKNLCERAILLNVSIGGFAGNKKDKVVTDEVARDKSANKDNVRVWKSLCKSSEMSKVTNAAQKLRQKLYQLSAPWGNNGDRVVKVSKYLEVKTELETLKREYYLAVADAVDVYENMISNDRVALGSMFNINDYPSKESFAGSFYVHITPKPIEKSDYRSGALDDEDIKEINQQIEERIAQAVKESQVSIVMRVREKVSHLLTRLADGEGKFHQSAIENCAIAIDEARALNISDDPSIDKLFDSIQEKIIVHDAANVRTSESARKLAVADAKIALAEIENVMEAFMG